MGRSRGVANAGDDDTSQRSKRRRVPSGGDALENITSQGGTDGKKALYHCNYCNKDISGKIRIKCSKCPDFDLCVECFSVGAEVTPHKSNHPYRVMDSLSFPLICADWNADEEILLLEGIEMYGLGNWAEVAEHVGTKSKAQCIDHYMNAYLSSPCFPLPDMSRVNGKNRKELLAMAKVQGEAKRGSSLLGETTLTDSPFSPSRVKMEDAIGDALNGRSPSNLTSGANKKASNVGHLKDSSDGPRPEDTHMDRSVGGKKPKYSGEEGPSMAELSGYNAKRQEFDPEYDNNAEQALAEMEFKDSDTDVERELKIRVLNIYLKRLDERKRRKDFIIERNLLYPNPLEKELSSEDKEVYERFKVFMRFLSPEDHANFLRNLVEERKLRNRIQDLQICRAAGCRTISEANAYLEQKRKKELEESMQKSKEAGASLKPQIQHKAINRPNMMKVGGAESEVGSPRSTILDAKKGSSTESPVGSTGAARSGWDDWDLTGLPGTDLLSVTEKRLCCETHLLPVHYLKMQEVIVKEIFKGTVHKKSDAYGFFKVEPAKVDLVYEMVVKKLGQIDGNPLA
ncbi:ADA2 2B isoform X2 [Carex rostrata]